MGRTSGSASSYEGDRAELVTLKMTKLDDESTPWQDRADGMPLRKLK